MQITDPISNPRLFIEQTRADAMQQLRPGQVVRAVVEAPADKGVARLDIGGVKVPVRTGMKLEIGQQLALDVVKSGNAPEFRVTSEMTTATTRTLALKQILPRQLPLNQLLDSLRSLTASPATASGVTSSVPATVPGGFGALVEQLLRQMTPPQPGQANRPGPLDQNLQRIANALQAPPGQAAQAGRESGSATGLAREVGQLINQTLSSNRPVTGAAIRQAFTQSGLFMEAHLLNGQPVQQDLKGNLLRLLERLEPLLSAPHPTVQTSAGKATEAGTTLQLLAARLFAELHHQAEGALARVQLHQLTSLPQDENSPKQVWQFELPIAHPDGHDEFFIQFERESRPTGQDGDRWSVTLNFNIPPTGPVSARLSLAGEEISSHFTAELADAADRIERLLPALNEAFVRAGLEVGKLSACQGTAVKRADQPCSPLPLLDERA